MRIDAFFAKICLSLKLQTRFGAAECARVYAYLLSCNWKSRVQSLEPLVPNLYLIFLGRNPSGSIHIGVFLVLTGRPVTDHGL